MDFLLKREHYRTRWRPDLIFPDLNMPILNGLQALKQISRYPELSDIPVYILSTGSNTLEKMRRFRFGAKAYFVKPGSVRQLNEIVQEVMHPGKENE